MLNRIRTTANAVDRLVRPQFPATSEKYFIMTAFIRGRPDSFNNFQSPWENSSKILKFSEDLETLLPVHSLKDDKNIQESVRLQIKIIFSTFHYALISSLIINRNKKRFV